jgi:chromosome segregation ATPase
MAPEDEQFYVRINGHEEILQNLESLEEVIQNINEAAQVLKQVRDVKEQALDTIYSNVQELNEGLENIEMEMPEVEGNQGGGTPEANLPESADVDVEVDNSVNEIHDELENLQRELSQLGNQ